MTAINVEQWVSEDDDSLGRCELNLFTLQLSPVKYGSSFTPEAILDLPDFYLWLLEGDFIVFVDGFMDIRAWNWKLDLWGYIKDDSNMAIDGPVGSICVLGYSILIISLARWPLKRDDVWDTYRVVQCDSGGDDISPLCSTEALCLSL